jgi:hypothetical protein
MNVAHLISNLYPGAILEMLHAVYKYKKHPLAVAGNSRKERHTDSRCEKIL